MRERFSRQCQPLIERGRSPSHRHRTHDQPEHPKPAARPLSPSAGRPPTMPNPESETQKNSRWVRSNSFGAALGGLPAPGPCSPTVWLQSVAVPGGQLPPACFHHGGDASPNGGHDQWRHNFAIPEGNRGSVTTTLVAPAATGSPPINRVTSHPSRPLRRIRMRGGDPVSGQMP